MFAKSAKIKARGIGRSRQFFFAPSLVPALRRARQSPLCREKMAPVSLCAPAGKPLQMIANESRHWLRLGARKNRGAAWLRDKITLVVPIMSANAIGPETPL